MSPKTRFYAITEPIQPIFRPKIINTKFCGLPPKLWLSLCYEHSLFSMRLSNGQSASSPFCVDFRSEYWNSKEVKNVSTIKRSTLLYEKTHKTRIKINLYCQIIWRCHLNIKCSSLLLFVFSECVFPRKSFININCSCLCRNWWTEWSQSFIFPI